MPPTPVIPWRTGDGPRPAVLAGPPEALPLVRGGRPQKRWRYVGVFGPELCLCAAVARVGIATVAWWAVWDRERRALAERTRRSARGIVVERGRVAVRDGSVNIALELDEGGGIETISPHGAQAIWTRKQGGVPVSGTVTAGGRTRKIHAGRAIVDESAGYHARHTAWHWSAGIGTDEDGRSVAWNLVAGLHDDARSSERTVWIDGEAHQAGPASFAPGLDGVTTADGGALRFRAEAVRAHREHLGIVVSEYEQPFGTVTGVLPRAGSLRDAHGVMERHTVRW